MAPRPDPGRLLPRRGVRLFAGRGGSGAGVGVGARPDAGRHPRSARRGVGRAPVAVGAGRGRAAPDRPPLSPRPATAAASPPDPCRGQDPRGCAVRAGRGAALPRACLCHRRAGGQSTRALFHRLAPAQSCGGEARRAPVAGAAGCAARSRLGAAALGGALRPVPAAALEPAGARYSLMASRTVPRPQPPSRRMDSAP